MTCEQFQQLMTKPVGKATCIEEDFTVGERDSLVEHLKNCPECTCWLDVEIEKDKKALGDQFWSHVAHGAQVRKSDLKDPETVDGDKEQWRQNRL